MSADDYLDKGMALLRAGDWNAANAAFDQWSDLVDAPAEDEEEFSRRVCVFFGVDPPVQPDWTDAVSVLKDQVEYAKELEQTIDRIEAALRD